MHRKLHWYNKPICKNGYVVKLGLGITDVSIDNCRMVIELIYYLFDEFNKTICEGRMIDPVEFDEIYDLLEGSKLPNPRIADGIRQYAVTFELNWQLRIGDGDSIEL